MADTVAAELLAFSEVIIFVVVVTVVVSSLGYETVVSSLGAFPVVLFDVVISDGYVVLKLSLL